MKFVRRINSIWVSGGASLLLTSLGFQSTVEQEGSLGEELVEAKVEHKVEEDALIAETLPEGTQAT